MAARDHFRAHARRRVELAAALRLHAAPAPPLPRRAVEPPAKAGPRLTLEWTGKSDPRPLLEAPVKAEPHPQAEEPPSPMGEGLLLPGVRVRDLGLGGAGIEIPEAPGREAAPIEREAPVTIEVLAPTLWDPLILSGSIAWVRRAGAGRGIRAGIRFEHREPAALYMLFRILSVQAPMP